MHAQLLQLGVSFDGGDAGVAEQTGLFGGVDAGDAEEVGDAGEVLAVGGLEAADEVPVDGGGEEGSFLGELLGVVFAEVGVGGGRVVEGEDVVCWFELGDGDEADLFED